MEQEFFKNGVKLSTLKFCAKLKLKKFRHKS